jgi:hypothetical protein
MVKGNHVYTLNHDLQSLDQKTKMKPEFCAKASSDYFIGDERQDPDYKMISHIDDIVKMVDGEIEYAEILQKQDKKKVLNCIYLGDQMTHLLYQIIVD